MFGYASGVMPRFEPFSGLRYSPSHVPCLDDVLCPPYDVISEPQRAALVARSAYNAVRLELPRCDEGEDAYTVAALLLDAWRDGGVLHRDHRRAFYGYRMTYADEAGRTRSTLGVIGALGLEGAGEAILPHEHTTPKAKSDRLQLLQATRANLSPIWALSPTSGLSSLLDAPAHPAERSCDEDGVTHELWPISADDEVDDIAEAVGSSPVLIADGHHRYETALAFREQQRAGDGRSGDHDLVMAMVVELADEQLSVGAIHRLLSGLPAGFDLPAALAARFELSATGAPDATLTERMRSAGGLAVHTPAGTWLAVPRPATTAAATHDLDSSRLEVALAGLPPHQVHYQHGWQAAVAAVGAGAADAAVLLRPPTVAQIAAIAQGSDRMPPKTTFFWPKPRTGLVIRELIA